MYYLAIAVAGALSGVLGGMGMGGGTVLIPLLSVFLGVDQKTAQSANLIGFLPMAAVALIIHAKNRLTEKRGLIPMIAGGTVFAVTGCLLFGALNGEVLRKAFGGFLCVLSVFQTAVFFSRKRNKRKICLCKMPNGKVVKICRKKVKNRAKTDGNG